ncbi:MAG: hypothetical protein GKS05_09210 [Nitrospirales bacterium]|nr:hypothetical protein [Nitrospirales bacterium]
MLHDALSFTPREVALLTDQEFFQTKVAISAKIRELLTQWQQAFHEELAGKTLLAPEALTLESSQFVKGEHLENFPYQYVDFPRFYTREEKFAFRSLFWWGHHVAFALILEGGQIQQYKKHLIDRFTQIADQGLCLCLGSSLWEWRYGSGYTMELTRDRKSETAAVLAHRRFFKLATFVPMNNPALSEGHLVDAGRQAFCAILPVITI